MGIDSGMDTISVMVAVTICYIRSIMCQASFPIYSYCPWSVFNRSL